MSDDSGLSVPTELVEAIAQILLEERQSPRASGLLTLVQISRSFYYAALPFIYRNLHLRSVKSALGCFQTICNNSLAAGSVQHLDIKRVLFFPTVPGPLPAREYDQIEGGLLKRVLSRVTRLRSFRFELELSQFHGNLNLGNAEQLIEEVFGSPHLYTFQLRTFVTNVLRDHMSQIERFLKTQPAIENLSFCAVENKRSYGWGDWTSAPLPNLRQLATSVQGHLLGRILYLIKQRPLEHIFLDFTMGSDGTRGEYKEIMPVLINKTGPVSATFRGRILELGRFIFYRDSSQDIGLPWEKNLKYISIILEDYREERESRTFYTILASILVSLCRGMPPLNAVFVNTVLASDSSFANLMGQFTVLANAALNSPHTGNPTFVVYFYDDLARGARLLKWNNGEWKMDEMNYWDVPVVPGMEFTWKENRTDIWDKAINLAI